VKASQQQGCKGLKAHRDLWLSACQHLAASDLIAVPKQVCVRDCDRVLFLFSYPSSHTVCFILWLTRTHPKATWPFSMQDKVRSRQDKWRVAWSLSFSLFLWNVLLVVHSTKTGDTHETVW